MATWERYRDALGTLGPADLARFALRRGYRRTREALGGRSVESSGADLLRALGVRDARAFARRLFDSGTEGWWGVDHRDRVRQALVEYPSARTRALDRADCARRGELRIFSRVLTAARDVPWNRDIVSGHVYPAGSAPELQIIVAGADPKFPWAMGRLDEAVALAQGAWSTDDPCTAQSYLERFMGHVTDFLEHNPVGVGIQWASPMEVALRAANLAQALRMFADAPGLDPAFILRVSAALLEHSRWVEVHLEDGWRVPNNHLVADWVGLAVVAALFPALPGSPGRLARALRGLEAEMLAQVHEDGYAFEGSVPYHRLSVELFTLGHLAAVAGGHPPSDRFQLRLRRMYEVVRAYCSEVGLAPQIGDNDSGRALALGDHGSLEHGYLLSLGAALLGMPELKDSRAEPSDELLWLLGEPGAQAYSRLPSSLPPSRFSSVAGGLHVLRGAGAVVSVCAGKVGQRGIGGHSHNDRLSFELHLEGVPIIVDPGTGTYTRDPKLRNALRGTRAHNTLELDSSEQSPFDPAQLFELPDRAQCIVDEQTTTASSERLVAHHDGYRRLDAPVTVHRSFVLERVDRGLSVTDSLEGQGAHLAVSRLHLAPGVRVETRPAAEDELRRARAIAGEGSDFRCEAHALHLDGCLRAVVLVSEELTVELNDAPYSPGYGELTRGPVLEARSHERAPTQFTTVLLFPRADAEDMPRCASAF